MGTMAFGQTWNIGYPNEKDVVATLVGGTLTISGSGDMMDFDWYFSPWSQTNKVVIQEGVTSIGGWAFSGCSSLTSIEIPSSVTSIGGAFFACVSLASIDVEGGNEYYSSENGVLFNKDKTTLMRYPQGKAGKYYFIPNSVTSIEGGAFYACRSLISIEIPNSVTSIGIMAFGICESLTHIAAQLLKNHKKQSKFGYFQAIFVS